LASLATQSLTVPPYEHRKMAALRPQKLQRERAVIVARAGSRHGMNLP
jgi:hypothetical protein